MQPSNQPPDRAADLADEMAELVRAGMPLLSGSRPAHLAGDLAAAAVELRHGDAADAATARLPAPLRGILGAAARGADGRSLLAAVQRFATHSREDRRTTRGALAYPVFVSLLVCIGIVWLATRPVPAIATIEAAHAGPIRGVPAGGIVWRSLTLPVLVGLPTLAAAACCWRWSARRRWRPAGAAAALACSARAALVATGCPTGDESRLVDEICGGAAADRGPQGTLLPLAAHAASYRDPVERAEALRAAARFYQAQDDRRHADRRRLLPIAGIVAAGFIVLLYGLTLFGPLTAAFETMAVNPPGAAP